MNFTATGSLQIPYQGCPETEAGYMAITRIVRNISAPHPYCVMLRREVWQQLNGLNPIFFGPYALLDLALRANRMGWRSIVAPQHRFQSLQNLFDNWPAIDRERFVSTWSSWFSKGDPYFNKNLDDQAKDYRLKQ
ncbi:MAG: hypothetical protein PHH11_08655, partial [Methylomonas sp.]|nr:hypothetical protein [Methylomonas sp.]